VTSAALPAPADAPLVEAAGLRRRFGPVTAVDDVGFAVRAGEVVAILGPNGAGKSTLMRLLTGYLPADAGRAAIIGVDVHKRPVEAARHFGYLPELGPLYAEMEPRGFLRFVAAARGLAGQAAGAAIEAAAERTAIGPFLRRPIDGLSKGMKRRVSLAATLLHDPPVLVLDEPTDGLDPHQKDAMHRLLRTMTRTKAILISTHLLDEAESIATRAIVLSRGRVRADGSPAALAAAAPGGTLADAFRHLTVPAETAAAAA
jgi:ABC-2 type transport system ATP-binding protein